MDEEGAGALTLKSVAESFGVAQPSLYKHVAGLEDLHGRLALVAARDLGRALRRAASGKAGADATPAQLLEFVYPDLDPRLVGAASRSLEAQLHYLASNR